jgi:hypothetical protein
MCYAQIGGLTVATFVTLVLVPVIYAIFVKDLKLVNWDAESAHAEGSAPQAPSPSTPAVASATV